MADEESARNFLPRRVDGSKQIIKLILHLSCLFVWHLATTKHNLRARHVLSDLARANYGTSVVAECNAWSAGKIPKPHSLQLCAPVTKVWKRGGRPQPPASEKPGITATLTERSQDPTSTCILIQSSHKRLQSSNATGSFLYLSWFASGCSRLWSRRFRFRLWLLLCSYIIIRHS